jgi:deoxyribonuclease V
VRRDGTLGLYVTGRSEEKEAKLIADGIDVRDGRVELEHYLFDDFDSAQPLALLVEWQKRLAARIRLTPLESIPETVAGLDVAYTSNESAVGAYTLFDLRENKVVWSHVVRKPASFPYIPGLLTFRELPLFVELLAAAREHGCAAPLLFVDGNGILHPRRSGIASGVGVVAGVPTIGVGKKLLCGRVEGNDEGRHPTGDVWLDGEIVAVSLRENPGSRPVYVSPGNLIDVASAASIARMAFRGHRLPEPLFQADALSKQAARQERST